MAITRFELRTSGVGSDPLCHLCHNDCLRLPTYFPSIVPLGVCVHRAAVRIPDVQVPLIRLRRRLGHVSRVLETPSRSETLSEFPHRGRRNGKPQSHQEVDGRRNRQKRFRIFGSGLDQDWDDPRSGSLGHPEVPIGGKTARQAWKKEEEEEYGKSICSL